MSTSVEIELTFLAARLPENLESLTHKRLHDIYFPVSSVHPTIRLRQRGSAFELTKKIQLDESDAGTQQEITVPLSEDEFKALAGVKGREVAKTRYYLPYNGLTAEIDIFEGALEGLVLVDFEFESPEQKDGFTPPGFCLADVTQAEFVAGGLLAGKAYSDIEARLKEFNYTPIVRQLNTAGA